MRNGKLLAEESPSYLLKTYRLNTLEQVFLTLCTRDEKVVSTNPKRQIAHKPLVVPTWTGEFRVSWKFENKFVFNAWKGSKEIGHEEPYYRTKILIFSLNWAGLAAFHKVNIV